MKITLEQGRNIFFSSDLHLNHSNICKATTIWNNPGDKVRDFSSLDKMNDTIINNINAKVGQDDWLVLLGDFSFGGHVLVPGFRNRIVCKNILYLYGNHDSQIKKKSNGYQDLFTHLMDYCELEVVCNPGTTLNSTYHFVMNHYPMASWNSMNKGWIQLFGHVHLPAKDKIREGKAMDVGIDGNNYQPYSLQEIVSIMRNQPISTITIPKDHHLNEVR